MALTAATISGQLSPDMVNTGGRPVGAITAAASRRALPVRQPGALDNAGTAWRSGKQRRKSGRPVALLAQFLKNALGLTKSNCNCAVIAGCGVAFIRPALNLVWIRRCCRIRQFFILSDVMTPLFDLATAIIRNLIRHNSVASGNAVITMRRAPYPTYAIRTRRPDKTTASHQAPRCIPDALNPPRSPHL